MREFSLWKQESFRLQMKKETGSEFSLWNRESLRITDRKGNSMDFFLWNRESLRITDRKGNSMGFSPMEPGVFTKKDMKNTNNSIKRNIYLILAVLWMVMIFYMSSRNAADSGEMSQSVGAWIARHLIPGFSEWAASRQQTFVEGIDFYIRKGAHASEYAVLGILWLQTLTAGSEGRCRKAEHEDKKKSGVSRRTGNNSSGPVEDTSRASFRFPAAAAALVLCLLYAASDEFHQLFVPGRSCQFRDVCIDTLGAAAGILLLAALKKLLQIRRNHPE